MSTVPVAVLFEIGNALLEGHLKYGGHNWRALGVSAKIYYDAALRHMLAWWSGENTDPDSGMSHISKAIAGLVILRDAMIHDMIVDDRPPASPQGWMQEIKQQTLAILDRYGAAAKTPYMESNRSEWEGLCQTECRPDRDPFEFQDEGRAEEFRPPIAFTPVRHFEDNQRLDQPTRISEGRREFLENDQS